MYMFCSINGRASIQVLKTTSCLIGSCCTFQNDLASFIDYHDYMLLSPVDACSNTFQFAQLLGDFGIICIRETILLTSLTCMCVPRMDTHTVQ